MHTYKFQLYNSSKNRYLVQDIELAREIYNHCIALHRRYYRLYGKHLSKYRLQQHLTKLKRGKFSHWKALNSQAIQDITDRIDRSYNAFFQHVKLHKGRKKSVPHFRKEKDYRSFTLKQTGYQFGEDNSVIIMGRKYRYFRSREIQGRIKTVTVKKAPTGKIFIFVVTDHVRTEIPTRTGKSVGMDFGLKDFLVLDSGDKISSPQHMKSSLGALKRTSRNYSLKLSGSRNREKAYLKLMRLHEKTANQRTDFFFKLATDLCRKYEFIAIENLNLDGMKRIWGRKVSDLAYGEFVRVLEYIASVRGVTVSKIDRFAPSSKACSFCGAVTELTLSDRTWTCPHCGKVHVRDVNAAINIRKLAFG